jgi:hypothetical protein
MAGSARSRRSTSPSSRTSTASTKRLTNGDNVYVLKDKQETGTFYASIWDAGGTDQIVYAGARNATVDLRRRR